eukprot:CAMPEP_0184855690 /NCGR_PEP_ID=MMETSP0580-20130426/842_1 /TAXON_ID=1118495 /ORGANISM="Dactyliosolen fragilissimus" /LENGTH=695 /DNA_ID=CAMNT_0027350255 /DNA_START=61 /DNA_END=2148 /DNA_ORIENTATION=-
MFGWINDCTESLVTEKFGVDKWHEIKKKGGCEVADGAFIRHQYYTDASTVSLVVAASEVLGLTVDQVLEAFGQYFMEFTRKNGYENLLSCQGSNLRLWLSNLNALHDHLQSSLPQGFVAPVFWVEDDQTFKDCILLHYFSERGSLLVPIVVGIVKEIASFHFQLEIKMERLQLQGEKEDVKFTTWRIDTCEPENRWKLSSDHLPSRETKKEPNAFQNAPPQCPFAAMAKDLGKSKLSEESKPNSDKANIDESNNKPKVDKTCPIDHSQVSLSADKVKECFPYHVVLNDEFVIIQVGNNLSKLLNNRPLVGCAIKDILYITRPVMGEWNFQFLQKIQDQTFFIEPVLDDEEKKNNFVKLKGNVINLQDSPMQIMLVLSPDAKNVLELRDMDLTMSDLPLQSFQRDAVFLGEHISSEVRSAHMLDKLSKKLAVERNLSNTLLYSMLPKHVADSLRQGKTYEPEHYDDVTLFFSDVVGFTDICSKLPPWDIIDMLNRLYSVMDYLAEKFELYKVETIGDAYMCCSGLPEKDPNNANKVANFAIAVIKCVQLVTSPFDEKPIQVRIGIHSGSCMAGVVGTLTPHYCLFGDMINTTSRHESTGEAGKIHSSLETFGKLQLSQSADQYDWTARGFVPMKGKGDMYTYWLDGATERNEAVSPEKLEELFNETAEMLSKKKWKKRSYFHQRGSSSSVVSLGSH